MKNKILLKAALLFSGVDGMVQAALIVPLLANISVSFPEARPWLNQTVSITALLMIPSILIAGKLAQYVSKKKILMFGTCVYLLGGLGGMLAQNIMTLVVTRAIEGIGVGFVYPMVPAMIAHLFEGQERAQMMGWQNACGGIFSFTLSIGAGYLALFHWKYAFLLYLIFVPVLFMQFILLPNFPPEKQDASIIVAKTAEKERLGRPVWLVAISMVLFMTFAMVATLKLAVFIAGEQIGTSAEAGIANSMMTFGSFVVSLFFAQFFKVLKKYTPVVALLLMGSCYLLLSIAHSSAMVVIAMCFFGFCMGLMFPYLFSTMAVVASKTNKTIALSLLGMAQFLGQFLTAFYIQGIEYFTKGVTRATFTTAGATLWICAAIVLILTILTKKRIETSRHALVNS